MNIDFSYLCQITFTFPLSIYLAKTFAHEPGPIYIVYMELWYDENDVNSTDSYQCSMIKIKVIRCWPAFHEGKHKMWMMYQYTHVSISCNISIFSKNFVVVFIPHLLFSIYSQDFCNIASYSITLFLFFFFFRLMFHFFFSMCSFFSFLYIISSQHEHVQLQIINMAQS